MPEVLTWDDLNRATLARQGLVDRWSLSPEAAVHRLGILQAQEPAGVWLSLAARLASFDPVTVDAAFAEGRIVRGTLIRITLGVCAREDFPAFHRAMDSTLRAARVNDRRFIETGLGGERLEAVLPGLLEYTQQPRTAEEIQEFLGGVLGVDHPRVWWALKTFAPLVQVPDSDPWLFGSGRQFRTGPDLTAAPSPEAAVEALLLRYLAAFGPASPQDFGRFTMLRSPLVTRALAALEGQLVRRAGPDGPLWDIPEAALPPGTSEVPVRLLPLWDQTLLAYTNPSRMFEPGVRERVAQVNGDLLPPVLVRGRVAGVWRPLDGGIEVSAFRAFEASTWDQIVVEAEALKPLLSRDPGVYGRYGHWWTKGLGATEVRLI